jgi:hypothetical protein
MAVYEVLGMAVELLIVEDRLDGASNFLYWKERVNLALKECDLLELVDKLVTPMTNLKSSDAHNKKEIKEKRVLLDSMKDHLIPHLNEKKTAKEMFYALASLFQRKNMNRKMILRNKLRLVHMSRSYNVTNYLMRITQVHDEIEAIGEKT